MTSLFGICLDDRHAIKKVCSDIIMSLNHYELAIIKNFLLGQQHYGLLNFSVKINGVSVKVMIDSGSSRDIIDKTVFHKLNLPGKKVPSVTISMADETPIICDTIASNVCLHFAHTTKIVNGRTRKARFKDCRDLSILDLKGSFQIILGQPFLVQRNPKIDWIRKTMRPVNQIHDASSQDSNDTGLIQVESVRVISDVPNSTREPMHAR